MYYIHNYITMYIITCIVYCPEKRIIDLFEKATWSFFRLFRLFCIRFSFAKPHVFCSDIIFSFC